MLSKPRPTIDAIRTIYRRDVNGRKFLCPKQKNKGKAGLLLEGLLGIPTSSACLDCLDGELKAFPQTKATSRTRLAKQAGLGDGDYIASETVAITMMKPKDLPTTSFEESRLYKKISNVLFTPYVRDGDHIEWLNEVLFNKEHPLFQEIKKDYETIQSFYVANEVTKGKIGKYLQVRTKGAGGKAPKTHAFYFRRQFLINIFL
jgi:DNA mismatch repair protein MutH